MSAENGDAIPAYCFDTCQIAAEQTTDGKLRVSRTAVYCPALAAHFAEVLAESLESGEPVPLSASTLTEATQERLGKNRPTRTATAARELAHDYRVDAQICAPLVAAMVESDQPAIAALPIRHMEFEQDLVQQAAQL